MAIFKKPILRALGQKSREMPTGLWTKCPSCGEVIHNLALAENLQVCPKCSHHFNLGSRERIESLERSRDEAAKAGAGSPPSP